MSKLELKEVVWVGANRRGWYFGVGRINDGWIGFAKGGRCLMVFPEVTRGCVLGVEDRELAIRMTGAIAQDPEQIYGGVTHWYVPPPLQGSPDDFRCEACAGVCCDGACKEVFA